MVESWVLLWMVLAQTWTLQDSVLRWVWIEGALGRIQKIEVTHEDSTSVTVLNILSTKEGLFARKDTLIWQRTLLSPRDSIFLAWLQDPSPPGLIVTQEGQVLTWSELSPYLTSTHRIGRPLVVALPVALVFGPILSPIVGFLTEFETGKRLDVEEAVYRWRSGTSPGWNANEMAFFFHVGYRSESRWKWKPNRWLRTPGTLDLGFSYWSYTRHLFAGGFRVRFFHDWISLEDTLGYALAVERRMGATLEQQGRIAFLHGPWLHLALVGSIGLGIDWSKTTTWRPGFSPAFFQSGILMNLLFSIGTHLWFRLPQSPWLLSIEWLRISQSNAGTNMTLQLGVGYAF